MTTMKPQLADSIDIKDIKQYLQNDQWCLEQKLDGDRILMKITDGVPQPLNRNGDPYSKRIPQGILYDCSGEKRFTGTWYLDGELLNEKFYIFDIPTVERSNDRVIPFKDNWKVNTKRILDEATPYYQRRAFLTRMFDAWKPSSCVLVYSAVGEEQKRELLADVKQANGEGVMLKEQQSPYYPGRRSRFTLKAKFTKTMEAFITEVSPTGKRSVALGVINREKGSAFGEIVDIGSVTMSDANLAKSKVGQVIEVRYLYCGNGHRLYQPAFLRFRDDKLATQCTADQLVFVNKDVVNPTRT